MRRVMAEAPVGDDVLDGDPTTARLETVAADLLGMERALFLPSGVMGNQIALALLARPATEVLLDADAHVFHFEEGAQGAQFLGLQLRPVPSEDGVLDAESLRGALRVQSRFTPEASVLVIENTHLMSGGRVLDVPGHRDLVRAAREAGLRVHLDGARLWNAATATGAAPAELCAGCDTVMVSLSKGLGAPVGSLLAGSEDGMERAWRLRRRWGGGMRQSGVLAAAALHALHHHREDIARDHERARRFAQRMGGLPGLSARSPETNIVLVDVEAGADAAVALLADLETRGVRLIRFGAARVRAVFHRDVDDADVERACDAVAASLEAET